MSKEKQSLRYIIAPLVSIIAFLILLFGASYAFFSQSIGGATAAANIANANLSLPRGCTFLANATNCVIASNAATSVSLTDNYISRAEMSQGYAGNSVAQSSCSLNVGIQGTAGCKCDYTINLEGQTTTNYRSGSMKVSILNEQTIDPLLPSEYQQVEYIQSSGTQKMSFPGIAANYTIYDDVEFLPGTARQLLSLSSGNTGAGQYWGSNVNGYYEVGPNANNILNISSLERNIVQIVHTGSKIVITVNGSSLERAGSISTFGYDLFGTASFLAKVKRYGLRVYNASDVLTAELVPCYRKSDGVIGMYDIVNNDFYTNTGSGTFTYGADVNEFDVESPYAKSGTLVVSTTNSAVYRNYNVTLKAYNINSSQNYLAGNNFVYKLVATPTCSFA